MFWACRRASIIFSYKVLSRLAAEATCSGTVETCLAIGVAKGTFSCVVISIVAHITDQSTRIVFNIKVIRITAS